MNAPGDMIARVLSLLRQWGWETGLDKVSTDPVPGLDAAARAALQPLQGVLSLGEAQPELQGLAGMAELLSWARAGRALAAMRQGSYGIAFDWLKRAAPPEGCADKALRATLAHFRGTTLCHDDHPVEALPCLREALELFGNEHFATAQVLDTLGMVYAALDNFSAARDFYKRAIAYKERCQDRVGLALSHGQLGRLALDWGELNEAEQQFRVNLDLTRTSDPHGSALMYGHLGRVALARGDAAEAGGFLDECIHRCRAKEWTRLEGYAHKDRALVYLAQDDVARAQQQLAEADRLFGALHFDEGSAHADRVRGKVLQAQGRYDEAERALRAAQAHFEQSKEWAEVARTQWELARVLRARAAPVSVVADNLVLALESAERCRRHILVRDIDAELRQVDPATHARHVYHRARGRAVSAETVSLVSGERETVTVLFLDLQGSTDYMRVTDPEVVMMTLNQMMADLRDVLLRHQVGVTAYLGDGFMALVLDRDHPREHARRGVNAALDLTEALREFNRPRKVLELPPLNARIGLSTGEVFLGNVGTYDKMDYTALGTTVNLAARLQSEADPGQPCISQGTYELVRDLFVFREGNPRLVKPKGLGEQKVWDVMGQKDPSPLVGPVGREGPS